MSEKQGGPDNPPGDVSFEDRLRAARVRQGLDKAPPESGRKPPDSSGPSPLGIGMRVGVEMASALAVAVAIGWLLDRWLHTKPLFIIVFVLLGGAAGVLNVWRMFAPRRQAP